MAQASLKVVKANKLSPVAGDIPVNFGGYRLFTVTISLADLFADYRDNANQRDTELRSTKHLMPVQPEHLELACLMTMTGEKILLNGHTRRLFYSKNGASAPQKFRMTVFEIIDPALDAKKEELRLYSSFDSRVAVKTSSHTIQGTMRSTNLTLSTPWLRSGAFANALRVAADFCGISTSKSNEELIEEFREELVAFDGILPKKGDFVSPFVAASIVMLRKAPKQQVVELLSSYQNGETAKMVQNGNSHSIYKLMRDYRSNGLNGNGRFPTNGADMSSAVTRFSKLIYLALTMGEKTMIDPSSIRSFTRARLQTLTVDTTEIVTPV